MEKITATFCVLTLMGVFLVSTTANEIQTSENSTTVKSPTTPSTIISSSPIAPTSFTEGNDITEDNGRAQQTTDNSNETTHKPVYTSGPVSGPVTSSLHTTSNTTKKPTVGPTHKVTPGGPAKATSNAPKSTTNPPHRIGQDSNKATYIIIFVILLVCLIGAVVYCCFQNKRRSFSLDRNNKNEDAQIPLSAVDPDVFEASPAKDMETFTAVDASVSANSASPADGVEKPDGEKASTEANDQQTESSADAQATVPLTDKPDELTVVELNDGEPAVSNKTSVESLDEPLNVSNNNNQQAAVIHDSGGNFTEICLNDLL